MSGIRLGRFLSILCIIVLVALAGIQARKQQAPQPVFADPLFADLAFLFLGGCFFDWLPDWLS